MKEHFSSRVTKLLVILALAIVASVMFVIVGCGGNTGTHTHTWVADSSKTNVTATCTTDGVNYFICSECGMTSTETIPATGHTWADNGALQEEPATCTENGYFYRLCEDCGYRETSSVIFATGHALNFADVTINAPTCTADGTISGTCANGCGETVTLSASEIKLGENLLGYTWEAAKAKEEAANDAAAKGEEVDYNLGTKETEAKFLKALGHDYATPATDKDHFHTCVTNYTNMSFDEDATKVTDEYWNYCKRCGEKFEVEDHTVPEGAIPCQAMAGQSYAYKCVECGKEIAPVSHSMQVMEKTGEDKYGDPIFEPAPSDAVLDCRYYSVCEWCGKVEVAKAHTYPTAGDTAHLRNCAHGDICTVCGDELNTALPHNSLGTDGKFGTHNGNTTATCTENGYKYVYCTMCKEREAAGETVEWVEDENYSIVETYYAAHKYVQEADPIKPLQSDPDAVNCVTGAKFRDVCSVCGNVRVAERPTLYSDKELKNKVKDGTNLGADTTYYYAEGDKVKEVKGADFSWLYKSVANSEEWTDAEGYFLDDTFKTQPKDHTLVQVDISKYTTEQYAQYKPQNCISGGNVLYKCSACDAEVWQPVMDARGNEIFDRTNHASKEKAPCAAHDTYVVDGKTYTYCVECDKGNHPLQYSITLKFKVADGVTGVTAPADVVYNVYGCWPEDYITSIDAAQIIADLNLGADKNFEYDFSSVKITLAETGAEITWDDIGKNDANNTRFDDNVVISNVVATPKVAYTIKFASAAGQPGITNVYDTDAFFSYTTGEGTVNNAALADRPVYKVTEDKSQAQPSNVFNNTAYDVTYYVLVDGKLEVINFATYDFNKVESDLTIYVVARALA